MNKKNYDNILFDLDGTITDPCIGITKSVAYAVEKMGFGRRDPDTFRSFIGPPLYDSFRDYLHISEEEAEKAVKFYREYYIPTGIYECRVYDGVENMLKVLKAHGKKIILATSKPEALANTVLKHFGLDVYFDLICGASMDNSRTKKGLVIAYALDKLGISSEDSRGSCVMIGDRRFDIEGGKENRLDALGVLYGYGSRGELTEADADGIFESAEELCGYLVK